MFQLMKLIITAAKSSLMDLYVFSKASISLNGTVTVCCARSLGIPGESGKPKVDTPGAQL